MRSIPIALDRDFIEDLTNWYIRRSRRRFWKSQDDADKAEAYATLYSVLLRLSKIAAPFIPFLSESIYRNLRTAEMPESVHLCDFPEVDASRVRVENQLNFGGPWLALGLVRRLGLDDFLHRTCRGP